MLQSRNVGECKTFYKERKFYSEGNVNCHMKCYLIGLILKVRVFGNQKVATIGFKWPTKSLNEDKNSFVPKIYSYDVIYLQIRRFVEVMFYLKEKNVLFKNQACKNLKALLCHPSIKILPNQLFLTEILMSSAISKNLLLVMLSRSLLK